MFLSSFFRYVEIGQNHHWARISCSPGRVPSMNFKNGFPSYGLGRLLGNPHLKHTPQEGRSQRKGARKSYSKFNKIRKPKLQKGTPR
jgi:hypothetical protein